MNEWALLAIGLCLGGVAAWLAASSKVSELRTQINQHRATLETKDQEIHHLHQQVRTEGEQKVAAQTELKQVQISLEEQKKLLETAGEKLSDTFNALAAEALNSNNQAFIAFSQKHF